MTKINNELQGILSAQKAIRDLAKDLGAKKAGSLYRKPMKDALVPFHQRIEATTPVDSGVLKDAVKSLVRKPNKKDLKNEDVTQDTVMLGKVGWQRKTGDDATYKQFLAVEYGNRDRNSTPVIRPAFTALHEQARSIFAKGLGENVNKAAKRLARKQKKGK